MCTEKNAFDDRSPNDKSVACLGKLAPAALGDCALCSAHSALPRGHEHRGSRSQHTGMMQIVRNLTGSQFHIL
jgi:hypothetical protein